MAARMINGGGAKHRGNDGSKANGKVTGKVTGKTNGKSGEAVAKSINFGPLATWIGFNLRMAQESAFQAFSRRSLEVGESPGRFATLTLIARNPGISQTALSRANGRDKSSLTPVLNDLARRVIRPRRAYSSWVTLPPALAR